MDGLHDGDGQLPDRDSTIASRVIPFGAYAAQYRPIEYVVEPKIQAGCLLTLTAPTGAGKTAWAILAALAVATGREDVLGQQVEKGRVVFCTFENPEGARMRIMSACAALAITFDAGDRSLCVVPTVMSPDALLTWLDLSAKNDGPFRLIIIDTLAAAFTGEDINNPTQAGNFVRKLRPLTALPGNPAVLVLAHPRKDAQKNELVPHGAGAILNEVDANLSLWPDPKTGSVELSWHGKFRGPDFPPTSYRYADTTSGAVLNAKGGHVPLTMLRPCDAEGAAPSNRSCIGQGQSVDQIDHLLRVICDEPLTIREIAKRAGMAASTATKHLDRAIEAGWVTRDDKGKPFATAAGRQRIGAA